jgi:hypothetical protein
VPHRETAKPRADERTAKDEREKAEVFDAVEGDQGKMRGLLLRTAGGGAVVRVKNVPFVGVSAGAPPGPCRDKGRGRGV